MEFTLYMNVYNNSECQKFIWSKNVLLAERNRWGISFLIWMQIRLSIGGVCYSWQGLVKSVPFVIYDAKCMFLSFGQFVSPCSVPCHMAISLGTWPFPYHSRVLQGTFRFTQPVPLFPNNFRYHPLFLPAHRPMDSQTLVCQEPSLGLENFPNKNSNANFTNK